MSLRTSVSPPATIALATGIPTLFSTRPMTAALPWSVRFTWDTAPATAPTPLRTPFRFPSTETAATSYVPTGIWFADQKPFASAVTAATRLPRRPLMKFPTKTCAPA